MIVALIISFYIVDQKKQGNSEKRSFLELALAFIEWPFIESDDSFYLEMKYLINY